MDESDMPEEWKEEETDELFQLYTGYAGSDGVLDYILEGLQEKNIVKAKQEVGTARLVLVDVLICRQAQV